MATDRLDDENVIFRIFMRAIKSFLRDAVAVSVIISFLMIILSLVIINIMYSFEIVEMQTLIEFKENLILIFIYMTLLIMFGLSLLRLKNIRC